MENFERELRIDESALDVEWLEQPRLFFKYAQQLTEAEREADLAKDNLDYVKAKLDLKIRGENTEKKPTEAQILSNIIIDEKYREAQTKFIDAKEKAKLLGVAVKAIDTRKNALENLVRLFGQQYFAAPKEPRDLPYEVQKRHGSNIADMKVKNKMRRKNEDE